MDRSIDQRVARPETRRPRRRTLATCALGLALLPCAAPAQPYKCTIDGRTVYQQTPCPVKSTSQRAVDVRGGNAAAASAAGSAAGTGTVEQRMVARYERERRIQTLEREITQREQAIAQRNVDMEAEIAALQRRQGRTRNNLAGATLHSSLSTEMQAVATKYQAMNEVDLERLRVLRAELAKLAP